MRVEDRRGGTHRGAGLQGDAFAGQVPQVVGVLFDLAGKSMGAQPDDQEQGAAACEFSCELLRVCVFLMFRATRGEHRLAVLRRESFFGEIFQVEPPRFGKFHEVSSTLADRRGVCHPSGEARWLHGIERFSCMFCEIREGEAERHEVHVERRGDRSGACEGTAVGFCETFGVVTVVESEGQSAFSCHGSGNVGER